MRYSRQNKILELIAKCDTLEELRDSVKRIMSGE